MLIIFLAASYAAARIIMFLDYFCVPFSNRTTVESSVLLTCDLIGATLWCDVSFIYSSLAPEDTWMEAAHAWVFFVELRGLRGGIFFSESFTWWFFQLTSWRHPMFQPRRSSCGGVINFSSHTSSATHYLPRCRETSVYCLGHYRWDGRWWSYLVLEQRVGFFCASFVLVRHHQSYCHFHQRTVSGCWQGRRRICWRIGSCILAIRLYSYNHMVCDWLSSPVGFHGGDLGSTTWIAEKRWEAWSIAHHLLLIQVRCTRMMRALQFAPST